MAVVLTRYFSLIHFLTPLSNLEAGTAQRLDTPNKITHLSELDVRYHRTEREKSS